MPNTSQKRKIQKRHTTVTLPSHHRYGTIFHPCICVFITSLSRKGREPTSGDEWRNLANGVGMCSRIRNNEGMFGLDSIRHSALFGETKTSAMSIPFLLMALALYLVVIGVYCDKLRCSIRIVADESDFTIVENITNLY